MFILFYWYGLYADAISPRGKLCCYVVTPVVCHSHGVLLQGLQLVVILWDSVRYLFTAIPIGYRHALFTAITSSVPWLLTLSIHLW